MPTKSRVAVLAANWKMNIGPSQARAFLQEFLAAYEPRENRRVIFFPPAVTLSTVSELIRGRNDVKAGVQNIYYEEKGAFTGETSAGLARDAGADFALAGHSERREIFKENDEDVRRKCRAALKGALSPILCVGETRWDRSEGRTVEVVGKQLRSVISHLDSSAVASMLIAYEPLWAIGTGDTASPSDASEVHQHIRFLLRQAVGDSTAASIPILYGGSVKPDNAGQLLAAPEIDGLLVGGASTKVDSWLEIVTA